MGELHEIQLPDGRRLAFSQFGPPEGLPVISFHGGLSCRLEVRFAEPIFHQLGVRLIAPDRPGIGRSDLQVSRRLIDWPRDVEYLADGLNIERFAVFGWSAGGPYALVCGRFLAHRITRLATVAGLAALDRPGAISELGLPADRILFPFCRLSPRAAGMLLTLTRLQSLRSVRNTLLSALTATGDPDVALLESLPLHEITESYREALRPGGFGTAHDYRILAGDWGFDPADVASEVLVWHGEQDGLLPVSHACRLVEALPHASLTLVAGRGHFLPRTCLRELLSALLA